MTEQDSSPSRDRVATATRPADMLSFVGGNGGLHRSIANSLVLIALLVGTAQALSQTPTRGGVAGRVLDQATGEPIPLATVEIVELERWIETDSLGRFRMIDMESSLVTIRIRCIGYEGIQRSLFIRPGRVLQMQYHLTQSAVVLPEITTKAKQPESIAVRSGFEERRRLGFGTFWDDAQIRQNEHRELVDLIYQTPGVTIARSGSQQFLANSRRLGNTQGRAGPCLLQIVVDGVAIWTPDGGGRNPRSNPPPDLTTLIPLSQLSAIEIHTSSSGIPMQLRRFGSDCGALMLWTRDGAVGGVRR